MMDGLWNALRLKFTINVPSKSNARHVRTETRNRAKRKAT
jgi:hypothetical protein